MHHPFFQYPLSLLFLLVFREFVEFPLQMDHEVARECVGIGLGACLGVDGVKDVAQVVQQVVSVCHDQHVQFVDGICDARVPHKIVFVERRVGVSPPRVHVEVGLNAKIGGEGEDALDSVVVIPCAEVGESLLTAGVTVALAVEVELYAVLAEYISQSQAFGKAVVDHYVFDRYLLVGADKVGAPRVVEGRALGETKMVLRTELEGKFFVGVGVPIARNVVHAAGLYACGAVVGVAVCERVFDSSEFGAISELHLPLLVECLVEVDAYVVGSHVFEAFVSAADVERVETVGEVHHVHHVGRCHLACQSDVYPAQ